MYSSRQTPPPYDSPYGSPYGSPHIGSPPRRQISSQYTEHSSRHPIVTPGQPNVQAPSTINEEDENEKEEGAKDDPPPQKFHTRQIITLINLCMANICSAMFGSLLAPFFADEAKNKKQASSVAVGFIFGCYPLVSFLVSPIWGYYMTRIGSKFMFCAGIFVCSSCACLYGVLEWSPPGTIYVVMCLITRSIEATAGAAVGTANLATATYNFPHHLSTVIGILNACSCIGLMAGPPIGGVLYSVGGFHLPFFVSGGLFMSCGFISIFLLPTPIGERNREHSDVSRIVLLKQPIVLIAGYLSSIGQLAIGFLDVTLAVHILQDIDKNLDHTFLGLVFLIPSGIVVLTAPLYGFVADKFKVVARPMMICGAFLGGASFLGMGPATFLPLPNELWVVLVSLGIAGVGWGTMILTYQEFSGAAKRIGLPEGMATQGLVSGIYNSMNAFGAFIGPIAAGGVIDKLGFPWSATIVASLTMFAGVLLICYMICTCTCCPELEKEYTPYIVDEVTVDPDNLRADDTGRTLGPDLVTVTPDLVPVSNVNSDLNRSENNDEFKSPKNTPVLEDTYLNPNIDQGAAVISPNLVGIQGVPINSTNQEEYKSCDNTPLLSCD